MGRVSVPSLFFLSDSASPLFFSSTSFLFTLLFKLFAFCTMGGSEVDPGGAAGDAFASSRWSNYRLYLNQSSSCFSMIIFLYLEKRRCAFEFRIRWRDILENNTMRAKANKMFRAVTRVVAKELEKLREKWKNNRSKEEEKVKWDLKEKREERSEETVSLHIFYHFLLAFISHSLSSSSSSRIHYVYCLFFLFGYLLFCFYLVLYAAVYFSRACAAGCAPAISMSVSTMEDTTDSLCAAENTNGRSISKMPNAWTCKRRQNRNIVLANNRRVGGREEGGKEGERKGRRQEEEGSKRAREKERGERKRERER